MASWRILGFGFLPYLAEAYQYAFVRTLRSTSDTTVGPQHPAYDYHLTGQGDLVLELRKVGELAS